MHRRSWWEISTGSCDLPRSEGRSQEEEGTLRWAWSSERPCLLEAKALRDLLADAHVTHRWPMAVVKLTKGGAARCSGTSTLVQLCPLTRYHEGHTSDPAPWVVAFLRAMVQLVSEDSGANLPKEESLKVCRLFSLTSKFLSWHPGDQDLVESSEDIFIPTWTAVMPGCGSGSSNQQQPQFPCCSASRWTTTVHSLVPLLFFPYPINQRLMLSYFCYHQCCFCFPAWRLSGTDLTDSDAPA